MPSDRYIEVELPNGSVIEFPDSMQASEISAAIIQNTQPGRLLNGLFNPEIKPAEFPRIGGPVDLGDMFSPARSTFLRPAPQTNEQRLLKLIRETTEGQQGSMYDLQPGVGDALAIERGVEASLPKVTPDLMGGANVKARDPYTAAFEFATALPVAGDLMLGAKAGLAGATAAGSLIPFMSKNVDEPVTGLARLLKNQFGGAGSVDEAVDAAGNLRMTHYGKKSHEVLDPEHHLTGLDRGTRSVMNRASDPDYVPRIFYAADTSEPYIPESGLGDFAHKVKTKLEGVYDWASDPDGLRAGARTQEEVTQAEKRIRDAGYKGIVFNTERGVIPVMFDPVRVPLSASDVPRVDFQASVPAELVRPSKNKFVGAPPGVKSRIGETKKVENYLSQAEAGMGGRLWYDNVAARMARDTGNLSGQRPGAQDQAAAVFADLSARTEVGANRLAQTRAVNQFATGRPVAAATGPRNKAVQQALETSTLSESDKLKVGTFGKQVRGLPTTRGTHDFRDAAQWGFATDATLGPAQHRWMDRVSDEAVRLANERKLGGFDDWTHDRLQAAVWVKHKADDMGIDPASLADELAKTDNALRANTFSEAIPSRELVDSNRLSNEAKEAYTNIFVEKFSNVDDQNAVAQQLGLFSPEQARAFGDFEGVTNPNIVTTILADPAKGSDVISEWSSEAQNFHGSLQGLLGGQADVATSYLRKSGKAGDINAARIPFHRSVTESDRAAFGNAIRKEMRLNDIGGDVIVNYRSPTELEVTWLGEGDNKGFRKIVKEVTGGKGIEAKNSGGLITYNDEFKPSAWMKELQNPKMRQAVEGMLPRLARDIERDLSSLPLTDKGRDIYQKTLQLIQGGGLKAVEDAVSKGVLPTAVIGAVLLAAREAPEEPAGGRGPL